MAAMVCCGLERRNARFAFSAAMNFDIAPGLAVMYEDVVMYAPTAYGRFDRLSKTLPPIFASDCALGGWNSAATAAPLRIADNSSAWVTRNLRPTELGLPRLAALLAPGGVLGFQMPGRLPGRSSVYVLDIAREMTGEPEWRDKLTDVYTSHDLLDPMGYIVALGDLGLRAEAWETRCAYPLTGGGRLVEYASGAVLRPALAPLRPEEAARFLAEFSRRVSSAFPPQVIGGESVEVLHQSRVFAVGQS